MVTVTKEIVGTRPTMITKTERTCDLCNARCTGVNGARHERLYKYEGDELCFECLWDVLITSGTVETVE